MAGRRRILRRAGLVVRSILDGLRRHQRSWHAADLFAAGALQCSAESTGARGDSLRLSLGVCVRASWSWLQSPS